MEEFTLTVYAFHYGPAAVKGGRAYVFDARSDGGYVKIFGTDGVLWQTVQEEDFRLLAGIWFFCSEARQAFDSMRQGAISAEEALTRPLVKAATQDRWILYFCLGELLRERYRRTGQDLGVAIRNLHKARWLGQRADQGVTKAVRDYCESAREVMVRCYRTAAKLPAFVQRNWYRSDDTLREIREYGCDSGALVKALPAVGREEGSE